MSRLRISVVEYLNTAPLVWGFTNGPLRGEYELSFTVPSLCAEALRTNTADIAILPAIEYQRMDGLVVLPDLAIASKRRVRSLLVIAKKPIEQARRIALDQSSRSTQALVRILCAEQWKITPEFFEAPSDPAGMLEEADAALLIGDPALRLGLDIESHSRPGASGEQVCRGASAGIAHAETVHVYDVVAEWRRMTGLPAVLAVWAAWPEKLTPQVAADFLASAEYGRLHIGEISAQASLEMGLPATVLEAYLRESIDFTLDAENLRGLEIYFHLAAELGLTSKARPIEWAQAQTDAMRASTRP